MKVLFFVLSLRSFRKYLSWNVNKKPQTKNLWAWSSTGANQADFTRTERTLTWIPYMSWKSLGDRKTDFTLFLPLTHLFQKSNYLFILFWISRSRKTSFPPAPPFWDIVFQSAFAHNIFAKINRKKLDIWIATVCKEDDCGTPPAFSQHIIKSNFFFKKKQTQAYSMFSWSGCHLWNRDLYVSSRSVLLTVSESSSEMFQLT